MISVSKGNFVQETYAYRRSRVTCKWAQSSSCTFPVVIRRLMGLDTTGIGTYSELDKSMDNCLYVFTDDPISKSNQIKVGSWEHREGPNISSTFNPFNTNAGNGRDFATRNDRTEEQRARHRGAV